MIVSQKLNTFENKQLNRLILCILRFASAKIHSIAITITQFICCRFPCRRRRRHQLGNAKLCIDYISCGWFMATIFWRLNFGMPMLMRNVCVCFSMGMFLGFHTQYSTICGSPNENFCHSTIFVPENTVTGCTYVRVIYILFRIL